MVISFVSKCFTQVVTKLLRLLTNISLISFFVNINCILPYNAKSAHFMRVLGIKKRNRRKKSQIPFHIFFFSLKKILK